MEELCQKCALIISLTGQDCSIIQHHTHVHELLEFSKKCVLCRAIVNGWPLKDARQRFPDIGEEYYSSMTLGLQLQESQTNSNRISWGILNVAITIPRHDFTFSANLTIATRPSATVQPGWTKSAFPLEGKYEAMKLWLNHCESQHPQCLPNDFSLPKRLIDVGVQGSEIKLIQTSQIKDRKIRYVTLSHCWGERLPLRTTADNELLLMGGIPNNMMPKTFRDAVSIARKLDIQHLWIDALCIRQDDDFEWQQEASKMHAIYAGSVLTIAASDACSSLDGCFAYGIGLDPLNVVQFETGGSAKTTRLVVRVYKGDVRRLTEETALNKRGWVLQEQCSYQTEFGVEFHNTQQMTTLPPVYSSQDLGSSWFQWMTDYSQRFFTYPKDRLAALAGVVQQYSILSKDKHIFGSWEQSIQQDLMWMRQSNTIVGGTDIIPGVPSWSWLDRCQKIFFYAWTIRSQVGVVKDHTRLISWEVSWSGLSLLSDITSAYLDLEGPVMELKLSVAHQAKDFNPPFLNVGNEKPNFDKDPSPWRCAGIFDRQEDPPEKNYMCLLIRSNTVHEMSSYRYPVREVFLVLEVCSSTGLKSNTYRRAGIAYFRGTKPQFDTTKRRKIRLV